MAAIATRIDCDIHPAVEGTRTTLLPYLDDHWKEQVVSRAIDGLDLNSYPPNMPFCGRADWRPAQGKPGSDLAMVQRGAFDQLGASHAICNVLYGAQAVFDPYMAAAFCKAINDWIAAGSRSTQGTSTRTPRQVLLARHMNAGSQLTPDSISTTLRPGNLPNTPS